MNADPEVMEFIGAPLSVAQAERLMDQLRDQIERDGWGLWALQERSTAQFLGFVGLSRPSFEADFTPCIEIGWRLARSAWGHGFATEGARAALAHAFGPLGLSEVVSFTAQVNTRSRAVMEQLGMWRAPAEDFDHPKVPPGSPLRRHVFHRLSAEQWRAGQ